MSLNETSKTLAVGETLALTATVTPNEATNKTLVWTSSNAAVASVDKGTVTAIAAGNAVIIVTTEDGGKTASCSVTVTVPVAGVSLNASDTAMVVGQTIVLTATVQPDNATNKTLAWTSSNPEIASVNDGNVTASAAGETTITVTTEDGKTASCSVTVTVPVVGVSLNVSDTILAPGETLVLKATVDPDNATNKTLAWTSSNPETASVKDGTVTAGSVGKAVITVTSEDGGKTVSCTVTVVPIITMTTTADEIQIYLTGSGTATVNWGDGTGETYQLYGDGYDVEITHTCTTSSGSRTITITGMDITGLGCSYNQLAALDVSKNTALTNLVCRFNQLIALDVSKNTALTYLDCEGNQLAALNLSKNTELSTLYCENNQLTALDLSENTALGWIWCYNNQMSAEALNALFGTLHAITIPDQTKTIRIDGNPGVAGCDKTIAEQRGWTVEGLTGRRMFEEKRKLPVRTGKKQ